LCLFEFERVVTPSFSVSLFRYLLPFVVVVVVAVEGVVDFGVILNK
jgi:hypothetical protein